MEPAVAVAEANLLTTNDNTIITAVSASAPLIQTGLNSLGEPAYRTTVRFAAKGQLGGFVWSGGLNSFEVE